MQKSKKVQEKYTSTQQQLNLKEFQYGYFEARAN
jgi:hypothetical protein